MARRRRRRRKSSFFPLLFRVAAILLIGGVIYYVTRDSATQKEMAETVAAKIGDKAEQVGDAAGAALSHSKDVIASKANTNALLVSNQVKNERNANVSGNGVSNAGVSNAGVSNAGVSKRKSSVGGFFSNFGSTSGPPSGAQTKVKPVANNADAIGFVQPNTGKPSVHQGPTANQIFDTMMGVYANARSYSDAGKVHLDYRQQNLPKREVMNFSTAWDRTRGTYRGELFESKIICDGQLLTCYIYDVDTKNFGRQQLVIPVETSPQTPTKVPPIGRLLSDDIARSFVSGSQDFPVKNPQRGQSSVLLPPAMTLLSRDIDTPWLSRAATKTRLPDEKIGTHDCYCIGMGVPSETKLYVDKSTSLIRQIDFPHALLADPLLASPDVKEIRLYATFPDAEINRPLNRVDFAVKTQPGATTVRQFVELAQTLPSDYLGKTIRDIQMIDRNGDSFDANDLHGRVTAVAWIGHEGWIPLVDQLSQLKRSGYGDFQFGVAYPPTMLSPVSGEVPIAIDALRTKERLGIPLLLDSGGASNPLQLNEFPVLLVFDHNAKVQFVRSMKDEHWSDELKTVLDRLAGGEDIAQEMLDGYLTHLDDYDASLRRVSAEDLLAGDAVVAQKSAKRPTPVRDTKVTLAPNKKWSQDSFAGPGNVLVLPDRAFGDARLAIFDGFQTLNLLDDRGQVLLRKKLDIPQNQGVSLARIGGGDRPVIAVFERRGSQVHFFDAALQLISSFPKLDESHDGILDCCPFHGDGKFLLSFNDHHGVYQFNPRTGNADLFAKMIATKTAVFDRRAVGLVNGEVIDLERGDILIANTAGDLSTIAMASGREGRFVSTARTATDQWDAVSYSDDFEALWSIELTSQLFGNEVEPISGVTTDAGETFWAFVDRVDTVRLISERGTWLGDFEAESAIHGVALAVDGNDVDLVVSTTDKVVCWALNYQAR